VKITYLNRREGEKQFRGVIWGQKLTLNHPSLMKLGFQPTAHKRERGRGRENEESKIASIGIICTPLF